MRRLSLIFAALLLFVTLAGCIPVRNDNLLDPDNPGANDPDYVDRDGLLQIIVFCEDWGNHFRDLFLMVDKYRWNGALDFARLDRATVKALINAPKFISNYEAADFPEEYSAPKAEILEITGEMNRILPELTVAIANKDLRALYSLRLVLEGYKNLVQAHQTYYTDYLNERVHLLPETHYPPLAKEYFTAILRLEGMDWINNYISIRDREGRQAFSLDKLKGHVEQVLPEFEKLYNEHRFFNVPQKWGGRNYNNILQESEYYIGRLKDLVNAIENDDSEEINSCLDGIKLVKSYLSSSMRPFM